ncbi:MAG: glycosyltransferase family 39 protein [Acidobacteriota bacterium]
MSSSPRPDDDSEAPREAAAPPIGSLPLADRQPLSRSQRRLVWLLLAFVFVMYFKSRVATSFDSGYSIHLAVSLLEEGDLDLEEYRDVALENDYRLMEIDGVLQSRYPVGPSVVAAPIVSVIASLGKYLFWVWDLDYFLRTQSPAAIERCVGSLFTVASVAVLFAVARLNLGFGLSMLVVFVSAFATSAWSVASRALWQHGPSMLFLSLALYVLLRARERASMAQYAGLYLGLAFAMRPTNALVVVVLTLFVLLQHREHFLRFMAWASVVAVPFVAYHVSVFGTPLPWYYSQGAGKWGLDARFFEAAAGTLISPGRGLFLYSPIFLFSLVGAYLLWRQKRWRGLETALAAVLILHWLAISSWKVWWGGTVFGPRLFADMIPFLVYFLLPVFEQLKEKTVRQRVLATALALSIGVSVYIHRSGARYWATWDWNIDPTNIDQDPSRLWDWDDPPFLRRTTKVERHDG